MIQIILRRKFVTNLILFAFPYLLVKPFWIFGIDRTVQNLVGDESYGLYFALFNFSMILNMLLDVGITSYNNRNIARHNFLLPKHLGNIVGLKLVLALVYAAFSLTIAAVIGYDKIQFHLLFFSYFQSVSYFVHIFTCVPISVRCTCFVPTASFLCSTVP